MARNIGLTEAEAVEQEAALWAKARAVMDQMVARKAELAKAGKHEHYDQQYLALERENIALLSERSGIRDSGAIPWLLAETGNVMDGPEVQAWTARVLVRVHHVVGADVTTEVVRAIRLDVRDRGYRHTMTFTDPEVLRELARQIEHELSLWEEE
jgi:hypothetical protein